MKARFKIQEIVFSLSLSLTHTHTHTHTLSIYLSLCLFPSPYSLFYMILSHIIIPSLACFLHFHLFLILHGYLSLYISYPFSFSFPLSLYFLFFEGYLPSLSLSPPLTSTKKGRECNVGILFSVSLTG